MDEQGTLEKFKRETEGMDWTKLLLYVQYSFSEWCELVVRGLDLGGVEVEMMFLDDDVAEVFYNRLQESMEND